ncbi:MAG: multidrug efflux RND transporter permease subunit [Planctomycetota bacterium]
MLSAFFINRPIFAGVIAIVMVLAGALSIPTLPVEQYPEIAPPTVQVTTVYPGADANTVADTVATLIEQEVNGVEGMIYMSSTSSDDGSYTLTVSFELGVDLDLAQVRVQNSVAVAEPRLPEEVRRQGITTKKQSTSLLMVLAPHSPNGTYDQLYLSNYASLNMKDVLARVKGVGDVTIFGAQDFSMRVWLDPDRLAARDLTTIDVLNALREQNVQVAAGKLGQEPTDIDTGFQLSLTAKGRLETAEEFGDIIIKVGDDQRVLRLRDIARVELGSQSYDSFTRFNGNLCPIIGIYQLPGSNALDVSNGVRAALEEMRPNFPDDFECPVFFDFTGFVSASIREVVTTLVVATILVFITVFVFLQDWRATLIPGIAIPVSIVATFAVISFFGLSLNMLTLFGLVLAIGIVVDDAIVVVENTARLINEEGMDPKDAAKQSMVEITGPVVATTLVLLAVFVPVSLLPGLTGVLYREFGITLSVATVLSSINALTLSPALCGVLLKPQSDGKKFFLWRAFDGFIDLNRRLYLAIVKLALRASIVVVLLFAGICAGTVFSFNAVPGGFLTQEDQAYLFINTQLPDAAKLARTDDVARRVEALVEDIPGIAGTVTIGGYSLLTGSAQPNTAAFVVILDPWGERTAPSLSAEAIAGEIARRLQGIPEAFAFPFLPPSVQGLGSGGGFDMRIQDRADSGLVALQQTSQDVMFTAKNDPDLVNVFSGFTASTPQLFIDIDRTKSKRLGVPLDIVFDTLQTNLGSSYVNDFNVFGRTFQVRAQADAPYRQTTDDLLQLQVRNADGDTLPMSTIASVEERAGAATIYRYNLFPAATLTGDSRPGFSSGEAIRRMEQHAAKVLPPGFGFEWTSIAYQSKAAGNVAIVAFLLAILFAYLFLSAQYESWTTPITILMTVPIGVLGAMSLTLLRGMDNNVYTQIGLVLLVALACKNAILIVEFAEQLFAKGKSLKDAASESASLRFRPILMTALSFVLGTFPLVIATGAGAASRQSIGTAVFGGMLLATFVGIFFIPTLYYVVRWVSIKLSGGSTAAKSDPDAVA